MEFEAMVDFFSHLKYAKRKYPMIISYNKHLSKLEKEDDKERELGLFKRFLVANQSIKDEKFDEPSFRTGKSSITLSMTNFVQGFEEENFWDKLRATELMIFPKGKPLPAPPSPTIAGITGALGSFADNPFFMDVVEQVKSMDNLPDITEMSDFMNAPQFHKIVNNIKGKIQTGEYTIKDLTSTVVKVIGTVKSEFDEETQNTLDVVTNTMTAAERNEPVDMAQILSLVSNMNLKM
jgi:hypothetical protein